MEGTQNSVQGGLGSSQDTPLTPAQAPVSSDACVTSQEPREFREFFLDSEPNETQAAVCSRKRQENRGRGHVKQSRHVLENARWEPREAPSSPDGLQLLRVPRGLPPCPGLAWRCLTLCSKRLEVTKVLRLQGEGDLQWGLTRRNNQASN